MLHVVCDSILVLAVGYMLHVLCDSLLALALAYSLSCAEEAMTHRSQRHRLMLRKF
jgi:hypothetical protein